MGGVNYQNIKFAPTISNPPAISTLIVERKDPEIPLITVIPTATINGTNRKQITNTQLIAEVTDELTLSYNITSGTLPTGLSLNSQTGIISGTPTVSTDKTTCIVTVSATGAESKNITVTFVISPSVPEIILTTTSDLISGTIETTNINYKIGASVTENVPLSFALTNNLPSGLSLNTVSGIISGVPLELANNTSSIIEISAPSAISKEFTAIFKIQQPDESQQFVSTVIVTDADTWMNGTYQITNIYQKGIGRSWRKLYPDSENVYCYLYYGTMYCSKYSDQVSGWHIYHDYDSTYSQYVNRSDNANPWNGNWESSTAGGATPNVTKGKIGTYDTPTSATFLNALVSFGAGSNELNGVWVSRNYGVGTSRRWSRQGNTAINMFYTNDQQSQENYYWYMAYMGSNYYANANLDPSTNNWFVTSNGSTPVPKIVKDWMIGSLGKESILVSNWQNPSSPHAYDGTYIIDDDTKVGPQRSWTLSGNTNYKITHQISVYNESFWAIKNISNNSNEDYGYNGIDPTDSNWYNSTVVPANAAIFKEVFLGKDSDTISTYVNMSINYQIEGFVFKPGVTLTYTLTSGTLPAGLSLDSTSGIISGTPTTEITTNCQFTISANGLISKTFTAAFIFSNIPENSCIVSGAYEYSGVNGLYILETPGSTGSDRKWIKDNNSNNYIQWQTGNINMYNSGYLKYYVTGADQNTNPWDSGLNWEINWSQRRRIAWTNCY